MSIRVQLTISGLCMFVPSKGKGPMHVLMPPTNHGGGHGMELHHVALVWDRAYETPDRPVLDDYLKYEKINARRLCIGEGVNDALVPGVALDKVVELRRDVYFHGVDDATLTVPSRVAGRAELYAGHAEDYLPRGAYFCLDDSGTCTEGNCASKKRCQEMVQDVRWDIQVDGNHLDMERFFAVASLNGGGVGGYPLPKQLHPVDGVVTLRLLHAVGDALPVDGEYPTDTGHVTLDHFKTYYDLGVPNTDMKRLVPVQRQGGPAPVAPAAMPSVICMPSQGKFH